MTFEQGDLIKTLNYDGDVVYAIVLESIRRFQYTEIRVIQDAKIRALIYDGNRGSVNLIQRINNEKRITK